MECLTLNVNYKPGKMLARGFFGRVYEIDSDGRYIMKLLKLGDQDEEGPGITLPQLELICYLWSSNSSDGLLDMQRVCGDSNETVMDVLDRVY